MNVMTHLSVSQERDQLRPIPSCYLLLDLWLRIALLGSCGLVFVGLASAHGTGTERDDECSPRPEIADSESIAHAYCLRGRYMRELWDS